METLRHFEDLAADVRQRIEELNRIEELDQERLTHRRLRITNGYIRRSARGDRHLAELKQRRLELDEKHIELSKAELRRDGLEDDLKFARQALLDSQVALQTDTTASRERVLRDEISSLGEQVVALRHRKTELNSVVSAEQVAIGELRVFRAEDGLAGPPTLYSDPALSFPQRGGTSVIVRW